MNSKSLLIAIAAFAVTTTGVSAYSGNALARSGLNKVQVSAIEDARELRASGKLSEARDKLVEAGIGEDELRAMHKAAHETRNAIREAIENNDYEAFKVAATGSPLADIITSETDFEQLYEAHELRLTGNWEEANEIMDELGFEKEHRWGKRQAFAGSFTPEQREALRAAKQSNDRETIKAIFDEAGFEPHIHHHKGR